jgi:hypothetical protein
VAQIEDRLPVRGQVRRLDGIADVVRPLVHTRN